MAMKITSKRPEDHWSAEPTSGQESSLVQGKFVGVHTDLKMKLADYRTAQGPVVARGAVTDNVNRLDPKGNVVNQDPMPSATAEGSITDITDRNGAVLTAGKTYWLHTGGGISASKPATTTNDIDQKVGWALTTKTLIIDIGTEIIHA